MKEDQRAETVEMNDAATRYLASLSDEYAKIKAIRKRGGFTLAEAANAAGITRQSLATRFRREGLKSEMAYDPVSHQRTRFYFPR